MSEKIVILSPRIHAAGGLHPKPGHAHSTGATATLSTVSTTPETQTRRAGVRYSHGLQYNPHSRPHSGLCTVSRRSQRITDHQPIQRAHLSTLLHHLRRGRRAALLLSGRLHATFHCRYRAARLRLRSGVGRPSGPLAARGSRGRREALRHALAGLCGRGGMGIESRPWAILPP